MDGGSVTSGGLSGESADMQEHLAFTDGFNSRYLPSATSRSFAIAVLDGRVANGGSAAVRGRSPTFRRLGRCWDCLVRFGGADSFMLTLISPTVLSLDETTQEPGNVFTQTRTCYPSATPSRAPGRLPVLIGAL